MWLCLLVCVIIWGELGTDGELFQDPGDLIEDPDRPLHLFQSVGLLGARGTLSCDVSDLSSLALVLWFKGAATEPLYSVDLRNGTASPWSSPELMNINTSYALSASTAALYLEPLKENHAGLYKCRLDYKDKPTRNYRINLTVIVPPERPVIYDIGRGEKPIPAFGPYEEGSDIELACKVHGGSPPPRVIWQLDNVTLDETFDFYENSNNTLNKLKLKNLNRKLQFSKLSCIAVNNNLIESPRTDMVIDLDLRPQSVEILTKEKNVVAERKYEVECRSVGSRPPAKITWLKRNRLLHNIATDFTEENSTVSVLSLVSSISDDGAYITCRAQNPKLKYRAIEDKWRLNVVYSPLVNISFGTGVNEDNIEEGDDIYLKCDIKANPKEHKISWYKDDLIVTPEGSSNVKTSGSKLILDRVSPDQSGTYRCGAENAEGHGVSQAKILRVRYMPSCKRRLTMTVGVLPLESVHLKCDVTGYPPPNNFHWNLIRGNTSVRLNTSNDQSLMYVPNSSADFGIISCAAENEVGLQIMPCRFQILALGYPSEPQNCSVTKLETTSLIVTCNESITRDINDPKHVTYFAVAIDSRTSEPREETSSSSPSVRFVNLEPSTNYELRIRSVNIRGVSDPHILKIKTMPEWRVSVSSILYYSCAACIVCAAVTTCAAIWWWCARTKPKKKSPSYDEVSLEAREVQASSLLQTENKIVIQENLTSPRNSSHSEGFVDCPEESVTPEQTLRVYKEKQKCSQSKDGRSLDDIARNYRMLLWGPKDRSYTLGRSTSNVGVSCRLGSAPSPLLEPLPHRYSSVGTLRESYI